MELEEPAASSPGLVRGNLVNEELYSRQLYVLGVAAQLRLQTCSVLVSGEISGLGAELCKNVCLAGVNELCLYDNAPCNARDLQSAGFLYSMQQVENAVPRAQAAMQGLRELNSNVVVTCLSEKPIYTAYDVVVLVNCTKEQIFEVSNALRSSPHHAEKTRLIATGVYGLLSYCFSDFGPQWEVLDLDGELAKSGLCVGVSEEIETEHAHGLNVGDGVKFSSPSNMVCTVKQVLAPNKFTISNAGRPVEGCYFEQIKPTQQITSHVPFTASLLQPRFCMNSFEDEAKPERLFRVLDKLWQQQCSNLPSTREEAMEFAERNFERTTEEFEIAQLVYINASPTASFMGGVAGQEVLKAATGKFTPLDQWLIHTPNRPALLWFASLPAAAAKLGALRVFVVGAGALGCELLKHLALLNMCQASLGGYCIVTDPDSIERSNLNRQFLFREHSVGKNKAEEAARACLQMNPKFTVKAMDLRVNQDSKDVFDDAFWEDLDFVINALDNVPSRLFVDSQCVYYGKALFESGTLGTKANVLPVIPHVTESYGSDPIKDERAENDIPACTLHAYPNAFEHCLHWSRDAVFERDMYCNPSEAKQYLAFPNGNRQADKVRIARSILVGTLPNDSIEFPFTCSRLCTFTQCLQFARMRFAELFAIKISLLLEQHPKDEVDGENTRFWSGKRRLPPSPKEFSLGNPMHLLFVTSMAKLLARVYGIACPVQVAAEDVPVLLPVESDCGDEPPTLQEDLKSLATAKAMQIDPQQFDKDDDLHVDLVWSAACIRAQNYSIPLQSKMDSKRIVGRIIPAIATTTAATCGLVSLEMLKYVLSDGETERKIEVFRNSNFNLATNTFAEFEPQPCRRNGRLGDLWTVIFLTGDLTVEEVVQEIASRLHGFQVTSVSTDGNVTLYNDLFANQDAVLTCRVSDLYRQVVGKEAPKGFIPLYIDGDFDDDDDEEEEDFTTLPPVRLRWNE